MLAADGRAFAAICAVLQFMQRGLLLVRRPLPTQVSSIFSQRMAPIFRKMCNCVDGSSLPAKVCRNRSLSLV